MHTCTVYFAVLRAQKRQSASWALWSTLALPNRPSRTFAYVYEGFACCESPKRTFGALGLSRAVPVAMRVRWADERTDGELGSRDGLPYGGPGSHSQPRPPLKGPGQNISRVRVCKHSPPTPISEGRALPPRAARERVCRSGRSHQCRPLYSPSFSPCGESSWWALMSHFIC